ncbi:DNA-binding transcriptional regulator, AcrR family [Amycolatopsis xylanica]|uniref:DNA-binding transcriptional regulator, AcrR family n=1 Tax=Amycolatopsis xylanica TaxID=589385 RepID=A0A1H3SMF7_9PSEU|nr:TetR/AcrR family transcriptional regulator [Amycolatopsis xylanica]SDZ39152.1 DNA-binding transcriptional regulator, AcrR family [Amycolatopsis xylanica]
MTRDTAPVARTRPLRRDAELNRRRIITSARVVFGQRGLDATLDDIAHHAGLGVGTVYRRFPSKEHLVEAMFAERLEEVRLVAEEALLNPDPWDGFANFVWTIVGLQAEDRGLREVMLSNAFGHAQVAEAKERMIPVCTELVERAKASGKLRADFAPTDLPLITLMIGSVAEYTQLAEPGLWKRSLGLLLDGLRGAPGAPSELAHEPLDTEALDNAMCSWRKRGS